MSTVTVQTLEAFSAAWNRHDIEALMSFMTEDCVFETAAGPDACGTRHVGAAAVRSAGPTGSARPASQPAKQAGPAAEASRVSRQP